MKRLITTLCLVAALSLMQASTSHAGIYYEARTTMDKGAGSSFVHAWIDGQNARVEFIESDIPSTGKGTYLITRDGGKTLYLVDPKKETYSEWDLAALMNLAEGMSGLMNLEFSDPEIELLEQGAGGDLLGYPTQRYKYRTSYDFRMKAFGMKRSNHTETIQEMWVSKDFEEAGLNAWLSKNGRTTGDSGLDRLITAEMDKIQGFPLKSTVVTTSVGGKKKKSQTTRSSTEVSVIRREDVTSDRFEIPANYEQVDMFGTKEGDDNPLSSIFGGRK